MKALKLHKYFYLNNGSNAKVNSDISHINFTTRVRDFYFVVSKKQTKKKKH